MTRRHAVRISLRKTAVSSILLGSTALGAGGLGCQTEPDRDLGWTVDSRGLEVRTDEPTEPFAAPVAEFAGRWIGTADDPLAVGGPGSAYAFPSGATTFVLDLTALDEPPGFDFPLLQGTLTFGAGAPPPPPTDPAVGYPVGVDYERLSYFGQGPLNSNDYHGPLPPTEGFAHTVEQVITGINLAEFAGSELTGVADGVVVLGYNTQEVLQPWCELQIPQPNSLGGYSCVGGGARVETDGGCERVVDNLDQLFAGVDLETTSPEEIEALLAQRQILEQEELDCDKLFLCETYRCECDAESCRANLDGLVEAGIPMTIGSSATLALRRTGDTLTGVFAGAVFENPRHLPVPIGTVTFVRAD